MTRSMRSSALRTRGRWQSRWPRCPKPKTMVSSGEIVRAQVGQIHRGGSTLTPESKPVASARCRKPREIAGRGALAPVEEVKKKLQAVIETTLPRTQRSILGAEAGIRSGRFGQGFVWRRVYR